MRLIDSRNLKFALLAFAVAACGGDPQGGDAPPPPEVAVQAVEAEPVEMKVTLPGRTAAHRVAEVRPQISGVIRERLFEEGAAVEAGEALYKIESGPYAAALASAEAALARAKALAIGAESRRARFADLVEFDAVSKQDYDDALAAAGEADADVAAARAQRDAAKIDVDRTTIEAPIDGRIGRSFVTVGALVEAGQEQALAAINDLDPIYVDVTQSASEMLAWKRRMDAGAVARGGEDSLDVSLILEDGKPYSQKGRLEFREVSVDPMTGAVTLRAVFPNPDNLLLPGMFVRAEIVQGVDPDAILVPQQAVSRNPQGEGVVYVVGADNKTETRVVETPRAVGDQWVVASGLKPGDRIVVEGFQRFQPGDAVTPVAASLASNNGAAPPKARVR